MRRCLSGMPVSSNEAKRSSTYSNAKIFQSSHAFLLPDEVAYSNDMISDGIDVSLHRPCAVDDERQVTEQVSQARIHRMTGNMSSTHMLFPAGPLPSTYFNSYPSTGGGGSGGLEGDLGL